MNPQRTPGYRNKSYFLLIGIQLPGKRRMLDMQVAINTQITLKI
jgi:hypothetical protein